MRETFIHFDRMKTNSSECKNNDSFNQKLSAEVFEQNELFYSNFMNII